MGIEAERDHVIAADALAQPRHALLPAERGARIGIVAVEGAAGEQQAAVRPAMAEARAAAHLPLRVRLHAGGAAGLARHWLGEADVDDAGERVRSVHGRGRAAIHFHALHQRRVDQREVERAALAVGRIVHAHAVEQDEREIGLTAARMVTKLPPPTPPVETARTPATSFSASISDTGWRRASASGVMVVSADARPRRCVWR